MKDAHKRSYFDCFYCNFNLKFKIVEIELRRPDEKLNFILLDFFYLNNIANSDFMK